MADCLVIQFAKAPVLGQVKTRLQSALSVEQCLQLHKALVQYTLSGLVKSAIADVELWGSDEHPWLRELAAGYSVPFRVQQGEDLGARMQQALAEGLQRYRKVLIVGSDCPQLDRDYLIAAIAALDDKPVVFGAAADGGYVLLGVTQPDVPVFDAIPWGSDRVLPQSCERLDSQGIAYTLLPARHDIDRPEDLLYVPTVLRESIGVNDGC